LIVKTFDVARLAVCSQEWVFVYFWRHLLSFWLRDHSLRILGFLGDRLGLGWQHNIITDQIILWNNLSIIQLNSIMNLWISPAWRQGYNNSYKGFGSQVWWMMKICKLTTGVQEIKTRWLLASILLPNQEKLHPNYVLFFSFGFGPEVSLKSCANSGGMTISCFLKVLA
jgi:hypothetical protein